MKGQTFQKPHMLKSLLHRTTSANPLWDFCIPLVVLWFCSSTGSRPWQVGPVIAMFLALVFPLWGLVRSIASIRSVSISSAIGLTSVLLLGAVTWVCWFVVQNSREWIAVAYSFKELVLLLLVGLFLIFSDYLMPGFSRKYALSKKVFRLDVIYKAAKTRGCEDMLNGLIISTLQKIGLAVCLGAVFNALLSYCILRKILSEVGCTMTQFNQAVALHGFLSVVIIFPFLFLVVIILGFLSISKMQYLLNIPWRRLIV